MYNTTLIVNYQNNKEYRACIRNLFKMETQIYNETLYEEPLDEETLDEQNYDNNKTTDMLDYIYSITKENSYFKELYGYGAGTMFSTNLEIGLVVLFSYDYFVLFHPCICSFIENPALFNESNIYFIQLKTKITK